MNLKIYRSLSITLILLILLQVSAIIAHNEQDYTSILISKGIRVPRGPLTGDFTKEFYKEINRIEFGIIKDNYIYPIIGLDKDIEYIDTPGYPMIPYYSFNLIINGYIKDVKIYIKPISLKETTLSNKIVPVPQPLLYDNSSSLEYKPNPEVYSLNKYFPGTLGSVIIRHGLLGKTLISVKVFPIQYNPISNKMLIVDKFIIYISYNKPLQTVFKNNYLVITTPSLVGIVNDTLAKYYRDKGYNVSIIDTDYIYKNYSPAPNITEYSGFYAPTYEDKTYSLLVQSYNWTLALKIISFLNSTLGNYSHVLIIGNAKDVPPSFYYEYSYYLMDPYNNWIPTDLFYADLNRDLVPDIYVGRIPFSDPKLVQYVIDKIIAWYNSSVIKSDKLYMSGGYPFGLAMMFGETALSSMILANETWSFYTVIMTRTSYNYSRNTVLSVLSGQENALWYFILSHGSGSSFADVRIGKGFETLATTSDLMSMKPNPAVPIVSSVACMNAAWDTDLVPPTWFMPPSIGQAILLSPAGGIAYIGSARVAAEIFGPFIFIRGLMINMYYGATLLHREIISTYNMYRLMGINATLGSVVGEGIARYIMATTWLKGMPKVSDIIISEVMKLSLLGDPFLILPSVNKKQAKPAILKIENENPIGYLKADIIFSFGTGEVPLYKPGIVGRLLLLGSGTGEVKVIENKIIGTTYSLIDYILITFNKTKITNGIGTYEDLFGPLRSGKVLIKFCIPGWGEARFLATSAGLIVSPERVKMGGIVKILGYGLDLLGYVSSLELYIGGRFISRVPVNTTSGFLNWTLALPYLMPGTYLVTLNLPSGYYSPDIGQLLKLLYGNITVYTTGELKLRIVSPVNVMTGEEVSVVILSLYRGEFIDAELDIKILDPSGNNINYTVEKIASGTYLVKFKASGKGVYRILVNAYNETKLVTLKGYDGKAIVAVDNLYDLGDLIKASSEDLRNLVLLLNTTLSNKLNNIINDIRVINNSIVVIDTKLGEIRGRLEEINNNVMIVNTSVGKLFVRIDQLNNDLKKEIIRLQDNLSTAINSAKNEITTSITESLNSLKSDLSSKISDESNKIITHIDEQYNQLKNNVTIIEAMIGILYLLTIVLGGLTLKSVSRKG